MSVFVDVKVDNSKACVDCVPHGTDARSTWFASVLGCGIVTFHVKPTVIDPARARPYRRRTPDRT
jgi:hypothetical protein